MTGRDFAAALAAELGMERIEPDDVEAILRLASVAAHSSERLAAPLCTYLAGRSGMTIDEVIAAADAVRART